MSLSGKIGENGILFSQSQAGVSLVGVLIAAAIMGALALGINQVVVNGMKASQSVGLKSDLNTTRDYLYSNLSCAQTIPVAIRNECAKSKVHVDLRWRNGETLLAKNSNNAAFGTPLGGWWVRASCGPDAKLTIERKRGTVTGKGKDAKQSTSADPLSGRATDWEDLFPGMQLCHGLFISGDAEPELAHEVKHLEFYPTGRFKAIGGDIKVEIKRIRENAGCKHEIMTDGKKVLSSKSGPASYSFVLNQDSLFEFAVEVEPLEGQCESFKKQNGLGSGLMMSKIGTNMWKLYIEDDLDSKDKVSVTWDDSIWTIVGTPL